SGLSGVETSPVSRPSPASFSRKSSRDCCKATILRARKTHAKTTLRPTMMILLADADMAQTEPVHSAVDTAATLHPIAMAADKIPVADTVAIPRPIDTAAVKMPVADMVATSHRTDMAADKTAVADTVAARKIATAAEHLREDRNRARRNRSHARCV